MCKWLSAHVLSEKRVTEIMTKAPIDTIESNLTAADVARIMKERSRACLIVVDNGKAVGIITERDMVRRVIAEGRSPPTTKVSDIMSSPIATVGTQATVSDVTKLLSKTRLRRAPVVENGKIVGIVSVTDIIRAVAAESDKDEEVFRAALRSS